MVTVVTATNSRGSASGSFSLTVGAGTVINPANYANVVVGQTFTGDLSLTAAQNSTCFVDCAFNGGRVQMTGCTHVAFLRPRRQGGSGDDRGFRCSNTGRCTDIIIEGGFIKDVPYDGVSVAGDPVGGQPYHRDVRILGVLFDNIGTAEAGSGLLHGVYAWGPVEIAGCVFKRCLSGNAVSMRGGGWVHDNFVDGCYESGFAYYGDHPAPTGAEMIFDRNVAVGVNTAGNASDTCVYLKTVPNAANLVRTFRLRDNIVDRANGVRVHSSYSGVAGVTVQTSGTLQRTPAQCRALFPAG